MLTSYSDSQSQHLFTGENRLERNAEQENENPNDNLDALNTGAC